VKEKNQIKKQNLKHYKKKNELQLQLVKLKQEDYQQNKEKLEKQKNEESKNLVKKIKKN